MVGQINLLNKIRQYTLNTFPHSVLLEGPTGCGKHTLCSEIALVLGLDKEDITDSLSYEYLTEIQLRTTPKLYIINTEDLNLRQQNIILKFLEEPSLCTYVVLLSKDKNLLLSTVVNRCVCFTFDKYTKEELLVFCSDERLLEYCKTPGRLININERVLSNTITLCDDILTKVEKVNYANFLNIANKFNYKDDYDKLDIELFFTIFLNKLLEEYYNTNDKKCFNLYNITMYHYNIFLSDSRLQYESVLRAYLSKVWRYMNED